MEFKDFASKIKNVIGGSDNAAIFTRKLFENIVSIDGLDITAENSDEAFRHYFGGTSIRSFCKKIMPYLEPENFAKYIDDLEDSNRELLVDSFDTDIDNLNQHNVADKLAELFKEIILNSLKSKNKCASNSSSQKIINKKILESGKAISEVLSEAMEALANSMNCKEDIKTEVIDDIPSDKQNTTIIQNQTNVIQNGDNNTNITNTGTITFNIGGNKNEQ